MRLIDADKLKFVPALIEPILVGDEPHWETIILKDRIDAAPTIDAMPRWIPVSERLPEEDVDVLISYRYREGEGYTKHTEIDITSFGTVYFGGHKVGNHTHWRPPFEYFESNYEVVAWMPLPKPYQEPVTHLESMHLYPKEKERLEALQSQGFEVVTCNNWLCPFNNDGYCVSPGHGDECTIYGDEDFKKYLDDVYNESFSLDLRELTRQLMIMKWGRENDDTKRD